MPRLRGLPATRHGALALALVCAVVAAVILVIALGQYRSSVKSSSKQATVFVATTEIEKGTTGDTIASQGLFKPTLVLEHSVSPGAITDSSMLTGKVASQNILPGQQLTVTDFTTSGGLATQLAPNQRAVELTVDSAHGVLEGVETGDRVDVYGDYQVQPPTGQSYSITKLLVPNALVLRAPAVSTTPSGGLNSSNGNSTADVVLDIGDADTGKLAFTADNGKVWLVLRPPNAKAFDPGLTTLQTLIYQLVENVKNGPTYTLKYPHATAVPAATGTAQSGTSSLATVIPSSSTASNSSQKGSNQ